MRVVIRKEVDVNQPIMLRRLSPLGKIIVAIKKEWQNTTFYKSNEIARKRKITQKRILREEEVKGAILKKIYQELESDTRVETTGKTKSVVLALDASVEDVLFDRVNSQGEIYQTGILSHTDFAPYNISIIRENPDFRRAFVNMPYMIAVSKKVVI